MTSTCTNPSVGKYVERKGHPQSKYIRIRTNLVVSSSKSKYDVDHEVYTCECSPNDFRPCGPGNKCFNYESNMECDENCSAGPKCLNQRFEKCIYRKVQAKPVESKGWGLITLEFIPSGAFIIEYLGELIDSYEFNRRFKQMNDEKAVNFYFLGVEKGLYIDSSKHGNESRFINHSCEPNCEAERWIVKGQTRVGIFAIIDIPRVSRSFFYDAFFNTQMIFNHFHRTQSWHLIMVGKMLTAYAIVERKRVVDELVENNNAEDSDVRWYWLIHWVTCFFHANHAKDRSQLIHIAKLSYVICMKKSRNSQYQTILFRF